ncbi:MAG: LamG domain-containing protein, partial [Planctomycetia bacterium]|nr:LamG domain-containing protein [Planctomycetia bacterium]
AELLLDLPLRLGDAELGNWNPGNFKTKAQIRNFTGCIDEFVMFSRALTGSEIQLLYMQGRPPL